MIIDNPEPQDLIVWCLPRIDFCTSLASGDNTASLPTKSSSVAKVTRAWAVVETGSQKLMKRAWYLVLGWDLYVLILAIRHPAAQVTLLTHSLNWSLVPSSRTFSSADLHIFVSTDMCLEMFEHRSMISCGDRSSTRVFFSRLQLNFISKPAKDIEYRSTSPGIAWQQSLKDIAQM